MTLTGTEACALVCMPTLTMGEAQRGPKLHLHTPLTAIYERTENLM